jgi:co-chaperonin GroES (HSP10)
MIKAANKNYVIEMIENENKNTTSGGIIIQHSDQTQLARILDVGPDVQESNIVPVGTKAVVNWSAVIMVKIGNEKVYIIHADQILGTVMDDQ